MIRAAVKVSVIVYTFLKKRYVKPTFAETMAEYVKALKSRGMI